MWVIPIIDWSLMRLSVKTSSYAPLLKTSQTTNVEEDAPGIFKHPSFAIIFIPNTKYIEITLKKYTDWFLFPFFILALIKDCYKHLLALPSPFIMLFHQHLKIRSFPESLSSMQQFLNFATPYLHPYLVSRSLTLDFFPPLLIVTKYVARVRLPKVGQAWEQTWELSTWIESACFMVSFVSIVFALVENANVACAHMCPSKIMSLLPKWEPLDPIASMSPLGPTWGEVWVYDFSYDYEFNQGESIVKLYHMTCIHLQVSLLNGNKICYLLLGERWMNSKCSNLVPRWILIAMTFHCECHFSLK